MFKKMKVSFWLVVTFCTLMFGTGVFAMPASGISLQYAQPSGETFTATVHGDENINWLTAETGEVIVQDNDKYWKYAENIKGQILPSKYKYTKSGLRPIEIVKDNDVIIQIKKGTFASGATDIAKASNNTGDSEAGVNSDIINSSDALSTQPIITLLVEFNDVKMKYSEAQWNNLFYGTTGSTVNNYYKEVSDGKFAFAPANESSGTTNDGIIKVLLNYNHPNTGSNTGYANQKIVSDALTAANPYINYSEFDTNGNGRIDTNELHVVTIVAGYEASYGGGVSPTVWGHRWATSVTLDGKYLSTYTQQGEVHYNHMATIGILCHELGHDLGLPDLYDYDGSSQGVGIHSIMAGGSWGSSGGYPGSSPTHFDGWSKVQLGFVTPTTVGTGDFSVKSFDTGEYNVLKVPTSISSQYFLIENRQNSGFDKGLYNYEKTFGIAIWHIDDTITASNYGVNNNEIRKGVDLEEANQGILGYSQLDKNNYSSYYHYYSSGNVTTFSPTSVPNSNLYDGTRTSVSIITNVLSANSMTVSIINAGVEIPPVISAISDSPDPFTPEGSNACTVTYILSKDAYTTTQIYDNTNRLIKTFESKILKIKGSNSFNWDGKDASGNIVSDGIYTYKITAIDKVGLSADPVSQTITVEKDIPVISNVSDNPDPFTGAGGTVATIGFNLSEDVNVNVKIYDQNNNHVKDLYIGQVAKGVKNVIWNGKNNIDKPAQNGIYTYKINAVDSANKVAIEANGTITINRGAPITLTLYGHKPDPTRFYTRITYATDQDAYVNLNIYDSNNNLVRTLIKNTQRTAGTHYTTWTGRDNNNIPVPSGVYTYVIEAEDFGGNVVGPFSGSVTIDRTAPEILSLSVSESPFTPSGSSNTSISYNLGEDGKTTVNIYKENNILVKTIINKDSQSSGINTVTWNGRDKYGDIVSDGTYIVKVSYTDNLGNRSLTKIGTIIVDGNVPTITLINTTPDALRVGDGLSINIKYSISENAHVTVNVFNKNGVLIKTLVDEEQIAGVQNAYWDGTNANDSYVDDDLYTYAINATDISDKPALEVIGTIRTDKTSVLISNVSINPLQFTPSGTIQYTISKDAKVTLSILNSNGNVIRVLESLTTKNSGMQTSIWDGRDLNGKYVLSGTYKYKIEAIDLVGFIAVPKEGEIILVAPDEDAPQITAVSDSPDPFRLGTNGAASTIKFTLSEKCDVNVSIYNNQNKLISIITNSTLNSGINNTLWDGKDGDANLVPDGVYNYRISASDNSGNIANEFIGTVTTDKTPVAITNISVSPEKFAISGKINYTLSEDATVTFIVYDNMNKEVRKILNAQILSSGPNTTIWNGQNESELDVQSGEYKFIINAIDKVGFFTTYQGKIIIDAPAPLISNLSNDPDIFIATGSNTVMINYTISSNANLTFKIYDSANKLVRTLKNNEPILRGQNVASWNGKNDSGILASDGLYTYKLTAVDSVGKSSNEAIGTMKIDKTGPKISDVSVTPTLFGTGSTSTIFYNLSETARVTIKLLDKSNNEVVTLVNNLTKNTGLNSVIWNGKDNSGNYIPGTYTVKISAIDDAAFKDEVSRIITLEDSSKPVVSDIFVSPNPFNANGDNTVNISYKLSKNSKVTVKIFDDYDELIKTIITNIDQSKGGNSIWWNGKDESGVLVFEGNYKVIINAIDVLGNSSNGGIGEIPVGDILILSNNLITPDPFMAGNNQKATISYTLSKNAVATIIIYDNQNKPVRIVYSGDAIKGTNIAVWDGKNLDGNIVEDGVYTYRIDASDSINNMQTSTGTFVVVSSSPEITNVYDSPDPFKADGSLATINYTLNKNSYITIEIIDSSNKSIKKIVNNIPINKGVNTSYWNGKDSSNTDLDDGIYTYKISAVDPFSSETTAISDTITIQKYPPAGSISNINITPNPYAPNSGSNALISYTLSDSGFVIIEIIDSNGVKVKTIENNVQKNSGDQLVEWDGKDNNNTKLTDGLFTLKITSNNQIGVGESDTKSFTIETVSPVISSVTDSPDPFKSNGVDLWNLSFTLSEDANVWLGLTDKNNMTVWTARPVIFTKGNRIIQLYGTNDSGNILADGLYNYKIWAIDFANKKSNEVTGTLTIDKTAPVITLETEDTISFDSSASVSYNLSEKSKITITIRNGNTIVKTLEDETIKNAGLNTIIWDGRDSTGSVVQNGEYIYTITSTDFVNLATSITGKLIKDSGDISVSNVSDTIDPFTPSEGNFTTINYSLSKDAYVNISIYNNLGDLIRTLVEDLPVSTGPNSSNWDGKNNNGAFINDGVYIYRINAIDTLGNSSIEVGGSITVDKMAPKISNFTANPYPFAPDGNEEMTIGYNISEDANVTIDVVDDSNDIIITLESKILKSSGNNVVKWDGFANGEIVPDDIYRVKITATDNAGNTTEYYDFIGIDVQTPYIVGVDDNPDPFNTTLVDFSTIHGEFSEWFKNAKATIYDSNNTRVKEIDMDNTIEFWWGWSGLNTSGNIVSDGLYTYKVNGFDLFDKAAVEKSGTITVDSSVLEITDLYFVPELDNPRGIINYTISKDAIVTIGIFDNSNNLINELCTDISKKAGENSIYWNGTQSGGNIGFGIYTYKISAVSQNHSNALPAIGVITFEKIDDDYIDETIDDNVGEDEIPNNVEDNSTVTSKNIIIKSFSDSPDPFDISIDKNYSLIKFELSDDATVTIKLFNTDLKLIRNVESEKDYTKGPKVIVWDGKNEEGNLVINGTYIYKITAVDDFDVVSEVMGTINIIGSSSVETAVNTQASLKNYRIIKNITLNPYLFDPNGTISYTLGEDAMITTTISNEADLVLGYLEEDSIKNSRTYSVEWDGKDGLGYDVLDGIYNYKIIAVSLNDSLRETAKGTIIVEKSKPVISNVSDTPDPFVVSTDKSSMIKYNLSEKSYITIKVYDANENLINTLENRDRPIGVNQVSWNGKDSKGNIVNSGVYTYRINAKDAYNKNANEYVGTITVKSTNILAPTISNVTISPNPYNPIGNNGGINPATISYTLSTSASVTISIYNSDDDLIRVIYENSNKDAGANTATWYGQNSLNKFVGIGYYKVIIKATNSVGFNEKVGTIQVK